MAKIKYALYSSHSVRGRVDLASPIQTLLIRIASYIGLVSFVVAALLSLRGISIFLGVTANDNSLMKGFLGLTGLVVNPFRSFFSYEITIVEVNTALAVVTILIINIIFQKILKTFIKEITHLHTDDKTAVA